MIRALVVDDSKFARQLIAEILDSDPDVEIVGSATSGREAIKMTEQLKPDVITMDIHMPDLDGFQATKEIMITWPTPIVIVSASASVKDVDTAMQALRMGALTVRMKPPGPASPDFEHAAQDLIDTIKMMSEVKVTRHRRTFAGEPVPAGQHPPKKPDARVVAVAASTGGPLALQCLLENLPATFPLPILVVQHIADGFVDGFVQWLDRLALLNVRIAQDGERVLSGCVYVAPQEHHLGMTASGVVELSKAPAIEGFRPSGSYLFRSVAEACGQQAVAVVLTGMGSDGVEGLKAVRHRGGLVVAQDEETSVVFGMPGVAVAEGLAHEVLPIGSIPSYLLELTK